MSNPGRQLSKWEATVFEWGGDHFSFSAAREAVGEWKGGLRAGLVRPFIHGRYFPFTRELFHGH